MIDMPRLARAAPRTARALLRRLEATRVTTALIVLGSISAHAQEGLRTYTTREARIKSNAPAAISKAVGARIDNYCAIFDEFYTALKLGRKNDNVIVARLFSTHDEFAEYCLRNTGMTDVPAAFFSPSLNAIVLYDDENDIYLRQTVFHECSHQFLNRYAYDVPKWLNEGLAEYFEGWRISPEGKLLEKRVSLFDLHLLQDAMRKGQGLALEKLVEMRPETFMEFGKSFPGLDPYLHYATSWGFVYASFHGGDEEDETRILRCLSDLNRTSKSDAYRDVDWKTVQARFERTILALKAEPRDATDHVLLARGYLRSRDWPKTLEHYEAARKADPKTPDSAYWIGYAYKRKGDYPKATEWLERACKESPKDPSAPYQLARIVSALDRESAEPDPVRGLALAQEASKAAGGSDPFYLFFVAECQARAGDTTKALVTARKALKLVDEESRPAYEKRFAALEKQR